MTRYIFEGDRHDIPVDDTQADALRKANIIYCSHALNGQYAFTNAFLESVSHDADRAYSYVAGYLEAMNRSRTDEEIVLQTNDLARIMLRLMGTGYEVPEGWKFYEALDPRSARAWRDACTVQEFMTATDPNDALSNIGDIGEGLGEELTAGEPSVLDKVTRPSQPAMVAAAREAADKAVAEIEAGHRREDEIADARRELDARMPPIWPLDADGAPTPDPVAEGIDSSYSPEAAELEEIGDGAFGDNPLTRERARNEAAALRATILPPIEQLLKPNGIDILDSDGRVAYQLPVKSGEITVRPVAGTVVKFDGYAVVPEAMLNDLLRLVDSVFSQYDVGTIKDWAEGGDAALPSNIALLADAAKLVRESTT